MLMPVTAQVSSQEYSKLEELGKKLERDTDLTTYQVAVIFAFQMFQFIAENFEDGWVFWYTNNENTIEAFRLTRPLTFRFIACNKAEEMILGRFEDANVKYIIYALNYLAQAVTMIELGYRLRRSRGNVIEDVTDLLGLSVFAPKRKAKVYTLR